MLRADISLSFLILSTNMPLRWCKKLSKYCRSGSATSVRSLILAARDSRTHSRPPSSRTAASRAQPVRGGQSRPEALRRLRQTKPPEFTLRITRRLPSLVCRVPLDTPLLNISGLTEAEQSRPRSQSHAQRCDASCPVEKMSSQSVTRSSS